MCVGSECSITLAGSARLAPIWKPAMRADEAGCRRCERSHQLIVGLGETANDGLGLSGGAVSRSALHERLHGSWAQMAFRRRIKDAGRRWKHESTFDDEL